MDRAPWVTFLTRETRLRRRPAPACSSGGLYGVLTESGRPVLHGTVTGGTGSYHGAKGAITALAGAVPRKIS